MHSHLKTPDRLKVEALQRTYYAFFPQISVTILIWFYLAVTHTGNSFIYWGLVPVVVIQAYRSAMIRLHRKNFDWLLSHYHFLMTLSFLTVFCVSLVALMVFIGSSISSSLGIIFTFNIIGTAAAATYSLASVPRIQRFYIALASIGFPIAAAIENTPFSLTCGAMFIIMIIFLIAVSSSHAKELLRTYEAEANLRIERKNLKKVINSVPGFVAMTNGSGKWIESSESFKEFEDAFILQTEQAEFQSSQADSLVKELSWKSKSGEELSYIVSFARLTDPENAIVIAGVPINELKAAHKEIEVQRSKAEYSARLATLGEMAAGVAHEINNPLSIIVVLAYQLKTLLEQDTSVSQTTLEKIKKISETAERISKIIKSLRYFSRQGEHDPFAPSDLPTLIEDTLQLCREKFAKHQIEFTVDRVPDVKIPARAVQISQVLINLLNNASDAVANSPQKKIHLGFQRTDQGLTISVVDSGSGVPDKIQQRIFEPFFTTKEVGQGTGLGLSVSRGILQDHQGDLSFQSQPGKTVFDVFIPFRRQAKIS